MVGSKAAVAISALMLIAAAAFRESAVRAEDVPADALAAVDRAAAVIVDLKPFYSGGLAVDFPNAKRNPWKFVPRGSQTFANVPLDIGGRIILWGQRNATVNSQIFPEKNDGIALNQKFETLYVYHCTFFDSPKGTPVYDIVLQYEDGTSAKDTIRYGEDVRDWYGVPDEAEVGPTSGRSELAWLGEALTEEGMVGRRPIQPLRFCLTAVTNPYPTRLVKSIDLVSSKNDSAGCILAMTLGKPTLMKRSSPR